jgi:filamentous hemagglutinin family protein
MLTNNLSQTKTAELLVRSIFTLGVFAGSSLPAFAQISAADNSAKNPSENPTIVNKAGDKFTITGGTQTDANLFHNFTTFGLVKDQIADFKLNGDIQNILGRVNGGAPSSIDGKIQITDAAGKIAKTNLYLMNPAGILFGTNASLDINGAFTATTARAIGFGNGNWFNAFDTNTNYANLTGNPSDLAFTNTPGSIFNAAKLQNVKQGQNINLVGGTVISTGDIITQGGKISIATVEGGKYVQISADGSILRLDLPIETNKQITASNSTFTAPSLSELLTGKTTTLLPIATGVTVDKNGVVKLVGDTRSILAGDIITQKLNTSGNPNGGVVSLKTQAGDIIVNSIDTSGQGFAAGGNGGDLNVDAGGLFRAIGFSDFAGNVSGIDLNGNPIKNHGVSIFTGGNRDFNVAEKDLRGGKINITYQGKSFLTGGEAKLDPNPNNSVGILVTLNEQFVFPEGVSGAVGAIVSRNSNGSLRVVLKDGVFTNPDGKPAAGFGITPLPVASRGGGGTGGTDGGTGGTGNGQTSNPDTQASRPKSKEDCTTGSTSVAINPTAAPTRSAGNANALSADPCQPNAGVGGILQILTDRK